MKECALCGAAARMYCDSDRASLCGPCDAKVHGANFLVARHARSLLCQRCQEPTPWRAAGTRLGRAACVCEKCVAGRRAGWEREVAGAERNRARQGAPRTAAAAAAERRDGGMRQAEEEEEDGEEDFDEGAFDDEEDEDGMVSEEGPEEEEEEEEEEEDEGEGELQVVPLAEVAGGSGRAPPPPPSTASSSSSDGCSPSRTIITIAATGHAKRARETAEHLASSQGHLVYSPSSRRAHHTSAPAAARPVTSDGDEASSSRPSKDRKTTAAAAPRWQPTGSLPHSPRTATVRRAPPDSASPS